LSGQSILITGGTGSFGRELIRVLLREHPRFTRIVVFSRDELKQSEMAESAEFAGPRLRFFLGDVRDRERVKRALEDVDTVVHAAALKQVPAGEYNPFEVIKTNVLGAQNVIEACMDSGVRRVVALSTDKAAAPINLYGATKLCSDKLFVAANHFRGKRDLKLSVVRYGNVMGSRGSVIPLFLRKRREGVLPITDARMTRFNITLRQGVDLVLSAMGTMWGGETFVPKIPSYRITDVADAIAPDARKVFTGIRPGEKLHEEMITAHDALNAVEFDDHYVMLPTMRIWDVDAYLRERRGTCCDPTFSYASDTNADWLSIDQLRALIKEHVDPTFDPGAPRPA
jgi:UDP-N-acetylglucosamine 4,6-dehydratase (inverting)